MKENVQIAFLTLLGSLIGSGGGILVSNKLTNYRIEQLEKKVDKHNNIVERTFELEGKVRENAHDIIEMKGRLNNAK